MHRSVYAVLLGLPLAPPGVHSSLLQKHLVVAEIHLNALEIFQLSITSFTEMKSAKEV